MSCLAYADTGDEHTPISCWLVGTKEFRPQCRLRIIPKRSKIIHKAHMMIFLPVQAALRVTTQRPALVDYLRDTKYNGDELSAGRAL
jgi:hypothetical protein